MTVANLKHVKKFENFLDAEFSTRTFGGIEPARAIVDIAGAVSLAFADSWRSETSLPLALTLSRGMDVALPVLIGTRTPGESAVEASNAKALLDDLFFMAHYYMLREYLYYTYNSAQSLEWSFKEERVVISFQDPSIPRQFAQLDNMSILDAIDVYSVTRERGARVRELLRGAVEFGEDDHIQECFEIISSEADLRLTKNFSVLGDVSSEIRFQRYSYSAFYEVSRYLLTKALYHRYYAESNSTWATFLFPASALLEEVCCATELEHEEVESVLRDLTYSEASGQLQPMYFPLVRHPNSSEYIMIPDRVIGTDWLAQFLRVHALKSPEHFLAHIGNKIGSGLVRHLEQQIGGYGYFTRSNILLRELDATAPDIDLVIVSREPTLGYYVFICEVKSPLPAVWAKDFLRVLRGDSLPKAFDQLERVVNVLKSPEGSVFLYEKVLSMDPEPLDDGVIVVKKIILTSQNSGMFFDRAREDTEIIDYRTFLRIIERSDGDTVYVLSALKELSNMFAPNIVQISTEIAGTKIEYDAVNRAHPKDFARAIWKSEGVDHTVAKEFFDSGETREKWARSVIGEGRANCVIVRDSGKLND